MYKNNHINIWFLFCECHHLGDSAKQPPRWKCDHCMLISFLISLFKSLNRDVIYGAVLNFDS